MKTPVPYLNHRYDLEITPSRVYSCTLAMRETFFGNQGGQAKRRA
jgi:hypothetical protein